MACAVGLGFTVLLARMKPTPTARPPLDQAKEVLEH